MESIATLFTSWGDVTLVTAVVFALLSVILTFLDRPSMQQQIIGWLAALLSTFGLIARLIAPTGVFEFGTFLKINNGMAWLLIAASVLFLLLVLALRRMN